MTLAALAAQGALELRLVHRRAALDPDPLGLLVKVLLGRLVVRVAPAARARRAPAPRRGRARLRLAGSGALAVHRPRCELLGARLGRAALLRRFLDVLVLPGTLRALLHSPGWHAHGVPASHLADAPDRGPRFRRPRGTRATRA